jgi:phthiocerol/phenolphthiocerol synthesis type-I polyketide synthase C
VYRIAASVDSQLASHHLHPALLDCAFQLIFQLLKERRRNPRWTGFRAVRMGRIALRSGMARPSFARATLLRRSSRSLQAEFAIFAADGSTIAVVSDVRFRSVRLSRNAADQLRCLAYHATPRPHPLTPAAARASPTPASELRSLIWSGGRR